LRSLAVVMAAFCLAIFNTNTHFMLISVLLIGGFAALIYGASVLIDSASSLARRLNIPDIVIGLTIVAFGTSAPELIVNIFASYSKSPEMVMGNVLGSNLFNILAILGVSSLIYPLAVQKQTTWKEIPLCLLAALAIWFMANDVLFDGADSMVVTRSEGLVLLLFFAIFLAYNVSLAIRGNDAASDVPHKNYTITKAVLFLLGGMVLLVAGGRAIVYSGVELARMFGMSERIIGLTIVSIGTSLPELAASVVAARKRNTDIAIGNVVGSNIFNTFLILGASAVIYPVGVSPTARVDIGLNIVASLLLFLFMFTGKHRKLDRWEGALFLLMYIGYMVYILQ
jgi:cation:H+ antiporter